MFDECLCKSYCNTVRYFWEIRFAQQISILSPFQGSIEGFGCKDSEQKGTKKKRQKDGRFLGFVESSSFQLSSQFKSRNWCPAMMTKGLGHFFAHQLALNPNHCANPNSLWWLPNNSYLPSAHTNWIRDMTFVSLYRRGIKCKEYKKAP